jgi:hypothetical protein
LAANILGHIVVQSFLTGIAGSTARTKARKNAAGLTLANCIHQRNLEFVMTISSLVTFHWSPTKANKTANHFEMSKAVLIRSVNDYC